MVATDGVDLDRAHGLRGLARARQERPAMAGRNSIGAASGDYHLWQDSLQDVALPEPPYIPFPRNHYRAAREQPEPLR